MTVVEFCRSENVSVASFYQWRHKTAGAAQTSSPEASPAAAEFLPVQVAAPTAWLADAPATSADVQVVFPNGVRMSLPTHDAALLRLSIETLAAADIQSGGA
jgi:hypothetical protein